jgi:hypothetical protein
MTCSRWLGGGHPAGGPGEGVFSPAVRWLWLSAETPAMTTASAAASPVRFRIPAWICSLNRNTPSRPAENGSRIVNPGCDAASGPAASAWEAKIIVPAPAAISTYGDQLETMAPMPSPRCELSSLMTAATKPHEIPVAAPSTAARRDRDALGR